MFIHLHLYKPIAFGVILIYKFCFNKNNSYLMINTNVSHQLEVYYCRYFVTQKIAGTSAKNGKEKKTVTCVSGSNILRKKNTKNFMEKLKL